MCDPGGDFVFAWKDEWKLQDSVAGDCTKRRSGVLTKHPPLIDSAKSDLVDGTAQMRHLDDPSVIHTLNDLVASGVTGSWTEFKLRDGRVLAYMPLFQPIIVWRAPDKVMRMATPASVNVFYRDGYLLLAENPWTVVDLASRKVLWSRTGAARVQFWPDGE